MKNIGIPEKSILLHTFNPGLAFEQCGTEKLRWFDPLPRDSTFQKPGPNSSLVSVCLASFEI